MIGAKHTPGPWMLHGKGRIGPEGDWIAEVRFSMKRAFSEEVSNGNLIAAAPEMLEALRKAETVVEDQIGDDTYVEGHIGRVLAAVRAAIAKAEGRS